MALLVTAYGTSRQASEPPVSEVAIASPAAVETATDSALREGRGDNVSVALAMAGIAGIVLMVVVVVAVGRRRTLVTARATVTLNGARPVVRPQRSELDLDVVNR